MLTFGCVLFLDLFALVNGPSGAGDQVLFKVAIVSPLVVILGVVTKFIHRLRQCKCWIQRVILIERIEQNKYLNTRNLEVQSNPIKFKYYYRLQLP
ncbi:hypothetical protein FGO68_gene11084 [Halteria grandinella]|uniref:Uncharacterized protein n=1 Tax=Halteria grandinella TaxID=5974 RepID=A0A8J8SXN7_HALGN|nr:hypothetical protein FGO68_gene11084 [Halteria grandinella]